MGQIFAQNALQHLESVFSKALLDISQTILQRRIKQNGNALNVQ